MNKPAEKLSRHQNFQLEAFLPYQLSILSNTISGQLHARYAEKHDLSMTAWRVLAILGTHPGISANRIAEIAAMDKVAVSRAVNALVDQDRVERKTSDTDRRRIQLRLTEQGQCIFDDVIPAALGFEQELLATLSPGEQQTLQILIAKLSTAVEPES